jgi:hypothetical protein
MAKYISVLISDEDLSYWSSIQWADTKAEIDKNKYYTAGVTLSIPKNVGDSKVGTKTVIEVSTLKSATASIYKLAVDSTNSVKLARGHADNKLLSLIESKFTK